MTTKALVQGSGEIRKEYSFAQTCRLKMFTGKKVLQPQRYVNNTLTICFNYSKKILWFLTTFIFLFFRITSPTTVSSCQNATESCSFFYPNTEYSNDFCFQVEAKNVLGNVSSDCVHIPLIKIGN